MGKEWELKYAVRKKEDLDAILAYTGGQAEEMTMSAVYYDTENLDLQKRKWTLRLRKEGARSVVTMKTAGDGFSRGEWEYEAQNLENCASHLVSLGAPQELLAILSAPLRPVCGAEFTRCAAKLTLPSAEVELALDYGRLFKGEKEVPLCEMELELKTGDPQAVLAYGEKLAEAFSLEKEPRSKFLRATSL